jgi:DNA-binding MarR family transcriptional regulator
MDHANAPDPLILRLREGFDRIAFVLRADLWAAAGNAGLNPTQAQILGLLASRPDGLRPKRIAAELAISAASITDTLGALQRKGLTKRGADPTDARAAIIRPTLKGQKIGAQIAQATSKVTSALAALPPAAQEELLLTQIALIRHLQNADAIPFQRMCVSCRHFQPHAYPHTAKPHHCAFVNAPIGARDIRLDCDEHEMSDTAIQARNWAILAKESSALHR